MSEANDPFWEPIQLGRDIQTLIDEIDETILDYINLAGPERKVSKRQVSSPYSATFRHDYLDSQSRGWFSNQPCWFYQEIRQI